MVIKWLGLSIFINREEFVNSAPDDTVEATRRRDC